MNYIKNQKPEFKLALLAIGLSIFGLIMIASASSVVAYERFQGARDYYYVYRQAIALVIGLVMMSLFSNIDYLKLKKLSVAIMLVSVALLIIVFLPGIGVGSKGAQRWINLGFTTLQPSELVKVTFIIYLSAWLESRKGQLGSVLGALLPFVAMIGLIALLIILQPDLGTLTIIILTSSILFYTAGAPKWQIGSLGLFLLTVFIVFVRSATYRWERFITFLNPSSQTLDQGYHVNQAFIAVGQGGFWGRGFGLSIQKMRYLPETYTDSIFAIIAEELGFFRSAIVVIAFVYLFILGANIAKKAPDTFGRLLALGLSASIIIQAFVNIAAMLGMVPLTGVTLPFISFGGTSLVITFIQIGILLNISKNGIES